MKVLQSQDGQAAASRFPLHAPSASGILVVRPPCVVPPQIALVARFLVISASGPADDPRAWRPGRRRLIDPRGPRISPDNARWPQRANFQPYAVREGVTAPAGARGRREGDVAGLTGREHLTMLDRQADGHGAVRRFLHGRSQQPLVDPVAGMRVVIAHDLGARERPDRCAHHDVARPVLVVVHA